MRESVRYFHAGFPEAASSAWSTWASLSATSSLPPATVTADKLAPIFVLQSVLNRVESFAFE